jgi:hypothetical protein
MSQLRRRRRRRRRRRSRSLLRNVVRLVFSLSLWRIDVFLQLIDLIESQQQHQFLQQRAHEPRKMPSSGM